METNKEKEKAEDWFCLRLVLPRSHQVGAVRSRSPKKREANAENLPNLNLYFSRHCVVLLKVVDSLRKTFSCVLLFRLQYFFFDRHPSLRGSALPSFLYSGVFLFENNPPQKTNRLLDWCSCLQSFLFSCPGFLDDVNSFLPNVTVAGDIFLYFVGLAITPAFSFFLFFLFLAFLSLSAFRLKKKKLVYREFIAERRVESRVPL